MYMGFFGAWVVLHATAAPPPTAGAAPTAMGWPAMFARTPAIPTRTCSQMVVILASVPLPAPAAAAVFGTMAMMDPKIVPRSSTTGILCFVVPAKGRRVGPRVVVGDLSPRRFRRSWAFPGGAHVFVSKPAAQGAGLRSGWRGRGLLRRSRVWLSRLQIPVDTYRAIVGARAGSPVFA